MATKTPYQAARSSSSTALALQKARENFQVLELDMVGQVSCSRCGEQESYQVLSRG